MAQHAKVMQLLDRKELDALEAFAREPARTVDECHEWMEAKGYVVSRSAVHRWMRAFLSDDRLMAAAEVSRGVMAAARSGNGTTDIVDAATLMLAQATQDTLIELQSKGSIETKDLQRMSTALRNSQATKVTIERLRDELKKRDDAAAAAVKEAEKAAAEGGSGEVVARKMRELLGLK